MLSENLKQISKQGSVIFIEEINREIHTTHTFSHAFMQTLDKACNIVS